MDTKELVERCRRREEQALGLLYTNYVRKMERVSRRYVKNEADVQDVVHDSFVIILTSIDRLKDAEKLESWMLTIVRNLSLKHLHQPLSVGMESMEEEAVEEESEPDYGKLLTIVEQLPLGYKNVLKLSVLEGLSHKEIGKMLGIAPHSSSSQLARAKVLVLRSVKRYGVLLLALTVAVISFLLPEKQTEQKTVIVEGKQGKDKEILQPDAAEKGSAVKVLVPAPLRNIGAQVLCEPTAEDTPQTPVPEAIGSDTTTTQPADTARREQRIVHDERPSDRLIAEDYPTKKNTEATRKNTEATKKNTDATRRKSADEDWALGVSFAGGSENNLLAQAQLPGSIGSGIDDPNGKDDPDFQAPDTIVNTGTRHYMPLTFGFSLSMSLSDRWSVETGLRYTLLRNDITTITSVSDGSMLPTTETTTQKLHYIGIPLKLTYKLWSGHLFSLYTSGGGAADIPLGTSNPLLWSVNFGAGFQYKLTPSVSLYAEPSLNYYLNSGSGTPTVRTDRPFEFIIPVGLRISW